jgi:hypothetical protein
VQEKLLFIIKGPMKAINGLLPETWGYFCMENCISITRNCHSHIHESTHLFCLPYSRYTLVFYFLVWPVGPKLMGHEEPPRLTAPSQWACLFLLHLYVWLFCWMTWSYGHTIIFWLVQLDFSLLKCLIVMWCLFGFWYTGDYLFLLHLCVGLFFWMAWSYDHMIIFWLMQLGFSLIVW